MSDITCPECGDSNTVNSLELWGVYEEDGAETSFTCLKCNTDLTITSTVVSWDFEVNVNE